MQYSNIFFDLDDTLYPSTNGIWASIRQRMNDYMLERLNIPPEQVSVIRHQYFEAYGTTLRGLQIHYQVDANDFLAYVHDLPIETIITPDPELRVLCCKTPAGLKKTSNKQVKSVAENFKRFEVKNLFGIMN